MCRGSPKEHGRPVSAREEEELNRRGKGRAEAGVGEVHNSEEARNERGAKEPQFQGNVTSGKRAEIG
ncbi:MAG: hypothetical protein WBW78_23480, partial [Terrimicrobiaceae bacterium]